MRHEEAIIQQLFVKEVSTHYPSILFTCAPATAKNPRQGNFNRRMGYRKGWPDLFFPYARKGFSGFYIEFKTDKGKMSEYQKAVRTELEKEGNKVSICRSFEEAMDQFKKYFSA